VRNSFGNRSSFVTSADVARVRASTGARKTMWTPEELEASQPRLMLAQPSWKVTASHNPAAAPGALTFTTWNTAAPQQPGMWFQVELPAAVQLTEIQFESPGQGGRGGGRGAAAAAAAAAGRGAANAGATAPGAAPAEAPAAAPAAPPAFTPPPPASPRRYKVEVSMDGTSWGTPVAEGEGRGQSTVIAFAPVRVKYVRITQTGTAEPPTPWSIQRLRLYEVAEPK
jgi:hypothetical protein